MNLPNDPVEKAKRRPVGKLAGGGIVGILLVVYTILQPVLNKQFGLNLPAIRNSDSAVVSSSGSSSTPKIEGKKSIPKFEVDDSKPSSTPMVKLDSETSKSKPSSESTAPNTRTSKNPPPGKSEIARKSTDKSSTKGPLSERIRPPPVDDKRMSPTKSSPSKTTVSKSNPNLKYGILQPIGRDNYLSPAGLRYTPGSEEGHRLKHLERHTKDQPGRPGKHGVFDGGMEKTLQILDQAYTKAKDGGHGTTKTEERGRTIYTVDLGKRIGFIGGRDGNRQRKPMARRVRIVLEGTRVITAYPL